MNLEELLQEAKDGNMVAQYDLAEQFGRRLKETDRDDEIKEYSRQAVYWLKQSAKQGYGPAVDAVRELNIQMGDTEQFLEDMAAEAAPPAETKAPEVKTPVGGDTRVMEPLGTREKVDNQALQDERQRADSVSRTNLLLAILLGVSLLLNIFLLVFLFRMVNERDQRPEPTPVMAATDEPTAAQETPTPTAKPTTKPTATPEPTVEPTPEPTPESRTGWLDLSKYPELEVVPAEEEIYDDYVYYAVTVSSALNMRSGPGTNYKQIGTIPDATKVGAVSKSGSWYLVYHDGKFGWVSSAYLTTNLNYSTEATATPAQVTSSAGDMTTW